MVQIIGATEGSYAGADANVDWNEPGQKGTWEVPNDCRDIVLRNWRISGFALPPTARYPKAAIRGIGFGQAPLRSLVIHEISFDGVYRPISLQDVDGCVISRCSTSGAQNPNLYEDVSHLVQAGNHWDF